MSDWSLTSLREKLIKIGAKVCYSACNFDPLMECALRAGQD